MKRLKISGLLLMIIFWACPSEGQPGNEWDNQTALMEASPTLNDSVEEIGYDLSYIWSIAGVEEDGQVIMLLNQNGSDLYGRAKYETDSDQPWNGLVVGMVEGDEVSLALTSQKGGVLCSNRLTGAYDPVAGSISGDLLQVCDGDITLRGEFRAIWINPDITSYNPAEVEPSSNSNAALSSGQSANATMTQDSATLAQASASSPSPSTQKSRFHDVREDADRILTGVGDISQIPIGMGGSGLP